MQGAGIEPGSPAYHSPVLPTELEEATQNEPRKALNQSFEAETSCHEILTNARGDALSLSLVSLVAGLGAGQLCWFVRCAG